VEESKFIENFSSAGPIRSRKSLEKIVEELLRVLSKEGIKHKKLKDKNIFVCSVGTSEGIVRLEVEIVNVNKSGDIRALNFKRTGGDVWAYKGVYDKIIKELSL